MYLSSEFSFLKIVWTPVHHIGICLCCPLDSSWRWWRLHCAHWSVPGLHAAARRNHRLSRCNSSPRFAFIIILACFSVSLIKIMHICLGINYKRDYCYLWSAVGPSFLQYTRDFMSLHSLPPWPLKFLNLKCCIYPCPLPVFLTAAAVA